MHELVHSDQTAYVKDRYIGESIRIVDYILEYTECNQLPGILFSADFEKAFDLIDHTFILVVLQKYGLDLTSSTRLKPYLLVLRVA